MRGGRKKFDLENPEEWKCSIDQSFLISLVRADVRIVPSRAIRFLTCRPNVIIIKGTYGIFRFDGIPAEYYGIYYIISYVDVAERCFNLKCFC